jgi:murein DD-endopeptidase MepM/ murein hydrolase activator NlpD
VAGFRRVVVVLATVLSACAAASAVEVGATGAATPPPVPAGVWGWPLAPGPDRLVHDFDPPAQRWLAGNRGVDLAGRRGEPVRAAGDGTVTFADEIAGIGVVSVTSGALRTTYEPLHVEVRPGQRVRSGSILGTLTRSGSHCLPETCLHWGLLRGDAYLDPLALLGLEQVRLLPLAPDQVDPGQINTA